MVAERKPEPEGGLEPIDRRAEPRTKDATLSALIEPDPFRPGEDRARIRSVNIPVWAIIGYLRALGPTITADSIAQTAQDFDITKRDVEAAVAYYVEHRESIDLRLKINAAAVA
jgi:uncharacterized protein (DUF433 family)